MALSLYRVQLQKQWASFNAGDVAYVDSTTGARLVAAGIGTALDALPATVAPPLPGVPLADFIDDGGLPLAQSSADSSVLQAVAGMLPGT